MELIHSATGTKVTASEYAASLMVGNGFEYAGGAETPELGDLTNAQLHEMLVERGVEAPKKASKAKLIEILSGVE